MAPVVSRTASHLKEGLHHGSSGHSYCRQRGLRAWRGRCRRRTGTLPLLNTAAPASTSTTATTSSGGAVSAGGSTSASGAGSASRCDDGRWIGADGINVTGRPDNLDHGDRGAVYLWHGTDGWHLRTTDASPGAHHYSGTITGSPGVRFLDVQKVRFEHDDHLDVEGNVFRYSFTTYTGIDGINFRVNACGEDRTHESLTFSMDINGHEDDPARIDLGDRKQHPDSATFNVRRGQA
jgi:hypothetical protein